MPWFRGDIQGMRAIAVALVLLYHARVPGFSGGFVGVDIFFVISGFLITGLILREIGSTGGFSPLAFYARRARRLLPATAVVLIGVGVLSFLTLPNTLWAGTAQDIRASALYFVNWHFAQRAVDYLSSGAAASPVQHFWSLAVEEQFYLVWPILLLALLSLSRKIRLSLHKTLLAGISLIAVPSFLWSVHLTATAPRAAFFISTTRAWELGMGAALALAVNRLRRIRPGAALIVGWVGLAAIMFAALRFDESTPFPSYAALLPTAGTAALIASGTPRFTSRLKQFLSIEPMQKIGTLSYSIYLWHWPLLVSATWLWAKPGSVLAPSTAALVVAVSMLPAWMNYRFVEAPIHHSATLGRQPHRSLAVGLACTTIGMLAGIGLRFYIPQSDVLITSPDAFQEQGVSIDWATGSPASASEASSPFVPADQDAVVTNPEAMGAGVLGFDPVSDPDARVADSFAFISPSPIAALQDVATLDGKLCIETPPVESAPCTYGSSDAEIVVAVVGDSKMHQWLPAIEEIADRRDWRIKTYLANSCALVRVPVPTFGALDEKCAVYNEDRYAALLGDDEIDFIITSQRVTQAYYPDESPDTRQQAMVEDLQNTWTELEDNGFDVIVILDSPSPPFAIPDCVATHPTELSTCAFPREEGFDASAAPTQLEALAGLDNVAAVDLYDWICPTEACPAVIGNVLVYRQGSHLTATYVRSLAPRLDEELQRAMGATEEG